MTPWRNRNRIGLVRNPGDPAQGIFLLLGVMLLFNVLNGGHSLPPTKQIIAVLASFVIATSIHEFMHAYTALRLGDSTAREMGRITLNPAAHFEPFGFFGMVMISLGYAFIGWGRPVLVNPNRLRGVRGAGIDGRKRAMGIVAIAGPVSNIVQAAVAAAVIRIADHTGTDLGQAGYYIGWYLWVNVLLASFNMIPVPPLDGHKILTAILPTFWYPVLAPMERYGALILFGLFFLASWFSFPSISAEMINPVRDLLLKVLL